MMRLNRGGLGKQKKKHLEISSKKVNENTSQDVSGWKKKSVKSKNTNQILIKLNWTHTLCIAKTRQNQNHLPKQCLTKKILHPICNYFVI